MPDYQDYVISNIRFEGEEFGSGALWFDLGGPAFREPEAMANMFVEADLFVQHLQLRQSNLHRAPKADAPVVCGDWARRLESAGFNWTGHLRAYIDEYLNLPALEQERLVWLYARRERTECLTPAPFYEWETWQADAATQPSWDDVMHALVNSLNSTALELYPEMLEYTAEHNNQLREIFESHSERLANQLVALADRVRREQESN